MADNSNNQNISTQLTQNVITKGKFHGIPKQNIFEAIFFPVAVGSIIVAINFTDLVTIASCLVLCPLLFFICIRGFYHRSVLQILQSEYKFRKNRRVLHLRDPKYVRKENRYANEETSDESYAERIARILREKLKDFIEKNSSNETDFGQ